jgi:hypothetical protein
MIISFTAPFNGLSLQVMQQEWVMTMKFIWETNWKEKKAIYFIIECIQSLTY